MKKQTCIGIVAIVAIVAWPAVETYRLSVAQKDLGARLEMEAQVTHRVALARSKSASVAKASNQDIPASKP